MNVKNVYWVIPIYNERYKLNNLLHEFKQYQIPINCLIMIDDGSTIGDILQYNTSSSEFILLRHEKNLGQGAALQTGIKHALDLGAEFIVTFDADGQHRVSDAINMIRYMQDNREVMCLLGSRFLGTTISIPWSKKIILKIGILYTALLTGHLFTDVHNGLRVFNSRVFHDFWFTDPGMGHASEILSTLVEKQIPFREFPVTIIYSEYSIGKGQKWYYFISLGINMLKAKFGK